MGKVRRCGPKSTIKLNVLWRIREMIFTANNVRNSHLNVVDNIDEMKNPRSVRPAHGHVGMDLFVGEVKIDFTANEIIYDDMLAR